MPLEISCTNEEKIRCVLAPKTKSGKVAKLDGPPVVTVTSGDATVVQDPATPNEFFVVSGDLPGDSTFLVDGDADLGAGVVDVQDTVLLHVLGAQAASLGLTADAPVLK